MPPSPPDLDDTAVDAASPPGADRTAAESTASRISSPAGSVARSLAWLYAIAGAIGLLAAATLLIEKIELIEDPTYVPSCSINPILSCGSVMRTDQAEAFGFPNPILGIAGFAIIVTVGMALLAGAGFRRWFWWGAQAGVTFGVVFVHWLIFQTLYRIDALCLYCIAVWIVTIPLFWYTTLHNLRHRSPTMGNRPAVIRRTIMEYHGVILTAWYLAITALVAQRFWDYWSTLLT